MKSDGKRNGNALVVHSDIYAFGGAEAIAIRVVDMLSRSFEKVTLVHSGGKLDCESIKHWSGIQLDPDRVQFISSGWLGAALGRRGSLIKFALAIRAAMRISKQYELVVNTYGECAIEAPKLIQIVHIPLFLFDRHSLEHLGVKNIGFLRYIVRRQYVKLCRLISKWDVGIISRQETIVESEWVLDCFRATYGGRKITRIYPSVSTGISPGSFEFVPFFNRKFGFVILGRLVPNKRIERAIEIIRKVRQQGHKLQLYIVGNGNPRYVKHLQRIIAGENFITIHSNFSREDLESLIVQQRFGIHSYEHEAFGLAPAEMQMLGCIVFVHDSGGQREIAQCSEQRYHDVNDAVLKILAVLESEELQMKLLGTAARVNREFTASEFETGFEKVMKSVMSSAVI